MSKRRTRCWSRAQLAGALLAATCCFHFSARGAPTMAPEPQRVREIAAMLREQPGTFGVPITDRQAWEAFAGSEGASNTIKQARRILRQPIPPFTEEIYKGIVKSGSRADHFFYYARRPGTLAPLCVAECLENKGRFLPRLEELIAELCREGTWVVAVRKQQSLDNWDGRRNTIDLNKAIRAWEMALAYHLLADQLQPATRQLIRDNLQRRVFTPYRAMLSGQQKPDFWLSVTNNWNAVCLAGVTGAALTILEPRAERAFFVAAAEKHSRNFLRGFPADGYCTEGLSYWNFGFGEYVMLSEGIWQATEGKLDLLDVPNIGNIALFGARIEMAQGIYPAFADCLPTTRPNAFVMDFVSRRLRLGLDDWEQPATSSTSGALYRRMVGLFPNSASQTPPAAERVATLPARHYFEHAGILVCRPGPGSQVQLAAAMKGGHNAEHHNHNDVGSFAVTMGFRSPILDLGAEVYTNRTFSSRRYESSILNSHGHPVPVVAGKLQETGRQARARVIRTDFTPTTDTLVLDLSLAYDVPTLRRLERTFVYSREGNGSLTVTDQVEFASPQAFGTALTTLGTRRPETPHSFVIQDREAALHVAIESSSQVIVKAEQVPEKLRVKQLGTRIGIDMAAPALQCTITTRITPVMPPRGTSGLVRNGGFEEQLVGWLLKDSGMSTLTTERAATGNACLHIVDTSTTKGSDALSDRFVLRPDTNYVLRGKVYAMSGGGVGVYAQLLGRRGERLQRTSPERRQSYLAVGETAEKKWVPFTRRFRTTGKTRYGRIWLHSFSGTPAEAYLDDLQLEPEATAP